MTLSSDGARYVKASIANVWTNPGLGALFATLVMFAFLRSPRATLPGDIVIRRENVSFYFPITTLILVSLVLSGILWLFHR